MTSQHAGDPKDILEAWVYKHFDAPFPNDHDKKLMASLTGLPRSQAPLPPDSGPRPCLALSVRIPPRLIER